MVGPGTPSPPFHILQVCETGRQLSKATVHMSLFSIWKCWDPQTLHGLVLLQATAGPLLAAPTNLNLPGASIAEDPAPPQP